jgi:hypothetical protein
MPPSYSHPQTIQVDGNEEDMDIALDGLPKRKVGPRQLR